MAVLILFNVGQSKVGLNTRGSVKKHGNGAGGGYGGQGGISHLLAHAPLLGLCMGHLLFAEYGLFVVWELALFFGKLLGHQVRLLVDESHYLFCSGKTLP